MNAVFQKFFRNAVFDYVRRGEELALQPLKSPD